MDTNTIEAVLGDYGLGALRSATPLDCDLRRPWRIVTDAGEYIIRECFLNTSPDDLTFEHHLAVWLVDHSFPVSRPVRTRAGTTWCTREGSPFAVYTVIAGQLFRPGNAEQARSAGAALSRFHLIASSFPQARRRALPRAFRTPQGNAQFLREKLPGRTEVARLVAQLDGLNEGVCSHQLRKALLFNDFHPGNVLFAGDEFSGAFDLDCCYWGPRLLDVARSVLGFSLTLEGGPGVPATPILHAKCGAAFLTGYRRVHRVPSAELRLLPTALRREVRAQALYDLREVAGRSGRWVDHEWELSKEQVDLVDARCGQLTEDVT